MAAAQRRVCGDECLERLHACHALKTPGAQDFVRSLVTKYLAALVLVIIDSFGAHQGSWNRPQSPEPARTADDHGKRIRVRCSRAGDREDGMGIG